MTRMRTKAFAWAVEQRRQLACGALSIFLAAFCGGCHSAQHTELTISAAASLTDALQQIEVTYRQSHPEIELKNNFGASGTLARQIEEGAPVDIFLSAATGPVDDLQKQGLTVTGSRRDLLRNSLVLIAPNGSHLSGFDQLAGKSVRRIALGDPASVPAGKYGMQVLTALDLAEAVRGKLVLAKDVRQVLAYVETGNVDAGIVYATDATISPAVHIVATAPDSTHAPIIYPAVVLAHGAHEAAARAFVDYLQSPVARAIFVKNGFTMDVK